ncbi:MAG TPA: acetyltransferase [Bryobacteraceae bacterium]|jgi:hypothetical protein
MASRFTKSCSPVQNIVQTAGWAVLSALCLAVSARSQILIKPVEAGDPVAILPSDMAIFESAEARKEIPCTVTPRKPDLGFDLRFHAGYEVMLPLSEVAGEGGTLTVVFRVRPQANRQGASYFVQHFNVPAVADDAKGDALLDGGVDLGEGAYHVDWLMRDRSERICSSSWDMEAELSAKDRDMDLFLPANTVKESPPEPFVNDTDVRRAARGETALTVKLLVNFSPQDALSSSLQRSDTDALVSILKAIQRNDHIGKISLVAFNMSEERVVYRQDTSEQIDFPALGKALQSVKLGTVNVQQLGERESETNFLQGLIESEVATPSHPDAVIFAGPKTMLKTDVPQEDLRRIGDVECPVFYMNYNLNPQAVPWKDSISHAIKAFRGTEYTISRPRDLWFSTSEMMSRILRSKRNKLAVVNTLPGGSR